MQRGGAVSVPEDGKAVRHLMEETCKFDNFHSGTATGLSAVSSSSINHNI